MIIYVHYIKACNTALVTPVVEYWMEQEMLYYIHTSGKHSITRTNPIPHNISRKDGKTTKLLSVLPGSVVVAVAQSLLYEVCRYLQVVV